MKYSIVAATGLGLMGMSALARGQDAPQAPAAPILVPAPGTAPAQPPPAGLADLKSQASYGLGLSIGRNLKAQAVDIDPELMARGLRDGITAARPLLTDEQIEKAVTAFQQQHAAKKMAEVKVVAEKNKAEGTAFLAANKARPGVVALPSGLQYKVVKDGTGATPKASDVVSAHYRGTLLDGTEFDNSYKRGQPLNIPVNGVIAGWTEALQRMKVGSRWQLFIPSELAYGETPQEGSPIPPNAVLVFDIELMGIGKAAPAAGTIAPPPAPSPDR